MSSFGVADREVVQNCVTIPSRCGLVRRDLSHPVHPVMSPEVCYSDIRGPPPPGRSWTGTRTRLGTPSETKVTQSLRMRHFPRVTEGGSDEDPIPHTLSYETVGPGRHTKVFPRIIVHKVPKSGIRWLSWTSGTRSIRRKKSSGFRPFRREGFPGQRGCTRTGREKGCTGTRPQFYLSGGTTTVLRVTCLTHGKVPVRTVSLVPPRDGTMGWRY